MRRLRARVLAAALCAAALGTPAGAQASPPPASEQRFGGIPPFSFTERSGATVTREDLLGAPWIGVPFFVRCTGPCPSLTADLRAKVYDELAGTGVRIVSFSVDPKLDTPEALAAYADRYSIDSDRWLFLTGDEEEMLSFVQQGLKVSAVRSEEAGLEYGQSITHGTTLPVIDAQGRIAGWYQCARSALGDAPGATEHQLDLLIARARALAGASYDDPTPAPSRLPLVNALLNGSACALLVGGWVAIRGGRRRLHAALMRAAFVVSAAFLACYLTYHFGVQQEVGPTRYHGTGWRQAAYLAMLVSHVGLAVVNLPMVLRTLWLAHRQDWERHRRLARWTFPIWLYVSITGVLVYLVLYPLNPAPVA